MAGLDELKVTIAETKGAIDLVSQKSDTAINLLQEVAATQKEHTSTIQRMQIEKAQTDGVVKDHEKRITKVESVTSEPLMKVLKVAGGIGGLLLLAILVFQILNSYVAVKGGP